MKVGIARPSNGRIRGPNVLKIRTIPVFTAWCAVRRRHRLGKPLRLVVNTSWSNRVDVAPVVLPLRMDQRVAVHLGRRGENEPGALFPGQAEGMTGADRTHLQRVNRQLQVIDRRRRRGEVQHHVDRPGTCTKSTMSHRNNRNLS